MAFLDNSGDIILDAVLTDTGRLRLAKGDGTFNIAKFALGDDEINYAIYNKNHASGSAYYDIELLQTPVLEAFTNNTSLLKSKLLSITRTNLLYLPVIRRNGVFDNDSFNTNTVPVGIADNTTNGMLTILVDTTTRLDVNIQGTQPYIIGDSLSSNSDPITFDQGIESNALGSGDDVTLDADLKETQYIIEIDNRLGYLADKDGNQATPSFVDDDNIASYYISQGTNDTYFDLSSANTAGTYASTLIDGPRGTRLQFLIGPSTDLASSTYLFTTIGTTAELGSPTPVAIYQIDTTIRITGATTGFQVSQPIRFVKKQ
jgi:hypothetical protein